MFKAFKHFQWHDNIRLDYSVDSYTRTMNPTNCENRVNNLEFTFHPLLKQVFKSKCKEIRCLYITSTLEPISASKLRGPSQTFASNSNTPSGVQQVFLQSKYSINC